MKLLDKANFNLCEKPPQSGLSAKRIRPAAAAVKAFLHFWRARREILRFAPGSLSGKMEHIDEHEHGKAIVDHNGH